MLVGKVVTIIQQIVVILYAKLSNAIIIFFLIENQNQLA